MPDKIYKVNQQKHQQLNFIYGGLIGIGIFATSLYSRFNDNRCAGHHRRSDRRNLAYLRDSGQCFHRVLSMGSPRILPLSNSSEKSESARSTGRERDRHNALKGIE